MLDGGAGCLSQSDTEGLAMCIVACAETLGKRQRKSEVACARLREISYMRHCSRKTHDVSAAPRFGHDLPYLALYDEKSLLRRIFRIMQQKARWN